MISPAFIFVSAGLTFYDEQGLLMFFVSYRFSRDMRRDE